MTAQVRIVGSYLSPYVRKVLACLHLKQIPYEIDPIVPFFGNDEFSRISPLRRIPVLVDDQVTLCDSTVICEYLDERHPQPPLFPSTPALRARARWLEEFADSRIGDVFIWRLFNQVAIRPAVWGEKADREALKSTLEVEVPAVLDYLERELPAAGFLFESVSIADLSIATFFRNAAFSRMTVDPARWPKTAAYVQRVLDLDAFARLRPFEDKMMSTPIAGHRAALQAMGAPLTAGTLATPMPRRGPMPT